MIVHSVQSFRLVSDDYAYFSCEWKVWLLWLLYINIITDSSVLIMWLLCDYRVIMIPVFTKTTLPTTNHQMGHLPCMKFRGATLWTLPQPMATSYGWMRFFQRRRPEQSLGVSKLADFPEMKRKLDKSREGNVPTIKIGTNNLRMCRTHLGGVAWLLFNFLCYYKIQMCKKWHAKLRVILCYQ